MDDHSLDVRPPPFSRVSRGGRARLSFAGAPPFERQTTVAASWRRSYAWRNSRLEFEAIGPPPSGDNGETGRRVQADVNGELGPPIPGRWRARRRMGVLTGRPAPRRWHSFHRGCAIDREKRIPRLNDTDNDKIAHKHCGSSYRVGVGESTARARSCHLAQARASDSRDFGFPPTHSELGADRGLSSRALSSSSSSGSA